MSNKTSAKYRSIDNLQHEMEEIKTPPMPVSKEQTEINNLRAENLRLQEKLKHFEEDAVYKGYYALNRIANIQVDFLNDFDLKSEITKDVSKDDKTYERAQKIWEGMEEMLISLHKLKVEFKITGDEEKDTSKKTFSLDSVAAART